MKHLRGQKHIKIILDREKERNYVAKELMDRQGPYKHQVIKDKRNKYRNKWHEQECFFEKEDDEGR